MDSSLKKPRHNCSERSIEVLLWFKTDHKVGDKKQKVPFKNEFKICIFFRWVVDYITGYEFQIEKKRGLTCDHGVHHWSESRFSIFFHDRSYKVTWTGRRNAKIQLTRSNKYNTLNTTHWTHQVSRRSLPYRVKFIGRITYRNKKKFSFYRSVLWDVRFKGFTVIL